MSTNDVSAALKFLTDAGHLLATTSPEISASILSQRNSLMFENELTPPDTQRQHVCNCCGHIMVPGQGSILSMKPMKPEKPVKRGLSRSATERRRKEARDQEPRSGPTKVITCGHCARRTEIKMPAPTPISRRITRTQKVSRAVKPGLPSSTLPLAFSQVTEVPKAPQVAAAMSIKANANASSKKRAKSRKAGLQALLDQANTNRSSRPGLGLSLADFMEK
ncbi:hypothetical protein B0H63DRAFT_152006 [Podospora didyma]|uniref:Uncharacterized protein n=1 Tax=Podospora didyma TaxID=330526 RepID=A0AAE0U1A7_9PEZI|nr:hypothetical protein B0H63DRAFT_152006 [Podospora didyma]